MHIQKRSGYVKLETMPEKGEVRDEILLQRMAAGDEECFRQFYERRNRSIYRFALHMTGRAEAAEEVVQETFMTVIRDVEKFDTARGTPEAFLYGIARNHVRRLLERERKYEPLARDNGDGEDPDAAGQIASPDEHLFEGLARVEIIEHVRSALSLLPPQYREAVTLCDLQEHDYASAAKILECPLGTLRSRLARGREMLAAKLRGARAASKPAGTRG